MTEGRRILWLILIMMAAVTVSTAVAIAVLYRTAFEQTRSSLIQTAEDQAHLMDAVARFDREHSGSGPGTSEAATLSQIQKAFDHYPGSVEIGEIVVAQRQGDRIDFLVTHGGTSPQPIAPVPWGSDRAEPMRRALSGQSGSMIGLDYRGERVLAAYHPVHVLGAGVVAKVDLAELRSPFLRGAATVIGMALLLISLGAVSFLRLTTPMVRHLNESEQRYRRIFHGAPVPIWEQDLSRVWEALQGLRQAGVTDLRRHLDDHPEALQQLVGTLRIREANRAALRLFGAGSARQLLAWVERELLPATRDLAAKMLQAMWEGQEAPLSARVGLRTLDGRDRTVILSLVVPSPGGGYGSVPLSALDVTANLNLRRREDELALILESTDEGIFGMDLEGRCTFVNRAALRILGYQHEKALLGRDIHAMIHGACGDGPPPGEGCPVLRACREGNAIRLEDDLLRRADGTCFPAQYSAYPMRREGTPVGSVVTFTDITERKVREAQLIQSQKMEAVGQLTGAIAHDFSNLLTIILTNLQVLEERLGEAADGELGEIIDDARSAARDGASLTRRLLSFSRQQPLEPQWMEVDAFLQHTGRFLRRVAGDGIALEVQRSGDPLPVRVDRQQLENVILNLAINARDAMPAGGTLTVAGRRERIDGEEAARLNLTPGCYVVVSISDTGVGMSPELARRAVEPFYSTKPLGKGSGLGLSTALRFAQQSGGDLRIESAPGQGTSVSLYLPEAPADAHAAEPAVAPARPSRGLPTVLVVDDERRMRRLARRTLSELGCQVLEAENAASAARLLEQDASIDLLFTDVVMPGEIDGRTLGQWARQKRPGLKVLLTSGFPQPAPEENADGDNLPFLGKPYSREQLQEAVQGLLDAPA